MQVPNLAFPRVAILTVGGVLLTAPVLFAPPRNATEKPGPPKSSFFDFRSVGRDFSPGVGLVPLTRCVATQGGLYTGNYLLDCDAEVPHNETTIVANPLDPNHIVGGYHSYHLTYVGANVISRVIGTVSVSKDGGATWNQVTPPITPYQFTGDPALAFDRRNRLYFANIADHEGPGGSFTAPSVVVAYSDDGGETWTNPITVAAGQGAVNRGGSAVLAFQDKEFIAADTGATSPYKNRVYVTWTSFQEFFAGPLGAFRSPIYVARSDNGVNWSAGQEISGFNSDCSVQFGGGPANQCDENQFSSPAVAPNGGVYVGFENFNTTAENQYMVVRSNDGGATWSAPVRVGTVSDINLPLNISGRGTLTGCQARIAAPGNVAVDPSNSNIVYAVWADNRNGVATATNMDVFLYRSTDGGSTWSSYDLDTAANDQFYPWVAVAPNGRVDVGYMDRSYSANQSVCKYGFSLSRVTFAGNVMSAPVKTRLDTRLSQIDLSRWFSGATNGNSLFIGDYNGVAIDSNNVTWSLWTDQRAEVASPWPSPTRRYGQHAVAARTP